MNIKKHQFYRFRKVRKIATNFPSPVKRIFRIFYGPRYIIRIALNRVLVFFGNRPGDTKIIFCAGYPKSGTTLIENFICMLPGYSGRTIHGQRKIIEMHDLPDNAFEGITHNCFAAFKTHLTPTTSNISVLLKNNINKVLVMYRDPRDIALSQYYHIISLKPWGANHVKYDEYINLSKEAGITKSLNLVISEYEDWLNGWHRANRDIKELDCLFITYEDLKINHEQVVSRIISHFGVNIEESYAAKIYTKATAKKNPSIFGSLLPGMRTTFRKGNIGDWEKEFTDDQKKIASIKFKLVLSKYFVNPTQ